jgi:flagellar basal-body rod protein FlgC
MIFFLAWLLTPLAHANSACELLEAAKQSIAVHAANYVNAETTRTPEGGPYKAKSLECKAECRIVESNKYVRKYEPQNPDADSEGYVRYPDVNKQQEYKSISAYAQILRRIHKECPDKAVIFDGKRSALISYKTGPIKLDIFDFKDDSDLVSWMRESKTGESKILNF